MSLKIMRYLLLLALITISVPSFAQKNFSFGIKGGVGFWRLTSFETPYYETMDYSYQAGFSFGFFIEKTLSTRISLVNEYSFQKSIEKATVITNIGGPLEQQITNYNLALAVILKFRMHELWNIYVLAGPDIAYLTKAEYSFNDLVYNDKGILDITKDLPKVSATAIFGLGKEIKLYNTKLIMELRAQLGITKYRYFSYQYPVPSIGNWRNSDLVFLVGIKL